MVKKTVNNGGNLLFWRKDGYLETVGKTNEYRLKKAHKLNFNLAPDFETRYSDDLAYDLVPSGKLGSWSMEIPATSDMISAKDMTATLVEDDEQTLSFWLHQLAAGNFPEISFRETLTDRQSTKKIAPLNFSGFLTELSTTEEADAFTIKLSGIISEYIDLKKA